MTCDRTRADCPLAQDYRAAFDAWAADPQNRTLWMRMNATLDGLEAQPVGVIRCPECHPRAEEAS